LRALSPPPVWRLRSICMSLQGFEIIKHRVLGLATVLLAPASIASNASAAEHNDLRFVTGASYPDVGSRSVPQVARLQRQAEGGIGGDMSGTSATDTGAVASRVD
jgi:hypothetical protein